MRHARKSLIDNTTLYVQFVTAMTSDERFQRDVTLGKRIGLYKFRGELGQGNFSRVRLGFHQLATGPCVCLSFVID